MQCFGVDLISVDTNIASRSTNIATVCRARTPLTKPRIFWICKSEYGNFGADGNSMDLLVIWPNYVCLVDVCAQNSFDSHSLYHFRRFDKPKPFQHI